MFSRSGSRGSKSRASSPAAGPSQPSQPGKSRRPALTLYPRKEGKCKVNKGYVNRLPDTGQRPTTAYFKSVSKERLAAPPQRKLQSMGLQLGDIHMHCAPGGKQYWLYEEGESGMKWKEIDLGYKRPKDGRYLSLTPNGNPSFVGDTWAHRNINDTIKRGKFNACFIPPRVLTSCHCRAPQGKRERC